jgi:16S rRNA (cytosine1402-N4)-methyltransferase
MPHTPVLVGEILEILQPAPDRVYVDCTVGFGGHASALMRAAGGKARLLGIDKDPYAIERAGRELVGYGDRVTLVRSDFRRLREILREQGLRGADGVIFDLGVSSPQLDQPDRGFSYRTSALLDMRMDPSLPLTAADLVNEAPEKDLERIIREFGEERWASRIARFVARERARSRIDSTLKLVEVIKAAIPAGARRSGPHPARRTFQALRIAVNDELGALAEGFEAAVDGLLGGGIVCVISFHSLEDRIIKQAQRRLAQMGALEIITKRPVVPSGEEVARNPRSRSAKLRAARKVLFAGEVE